MKSKSSIPWILVAVVPLISFLVGCGGPGDTPELVPVTGTVTLDGEPLAGARIMFAPTGGGSPSNGRTDENGEYELIYSREENGAIPGEHKVKIMTYQARLSAEDEGVPEKVPAKYNSETELVRTVEAGGGEINFELESGGDVVQPGEEE